MPEVSGGTLAKSLQAAAQAQQRVVDAARDAAATTKPPAPEKPPTPATPAKG